MPRIRIIEIENFRSIQSLTWFPTSGINCLVGPGDSGKSTIIDAIDFCLGARRNVQFTDSDFHSLDITKPISITITFGELGRELQSFDAYGLYLRGYDTALKIVEDEPSKERGLETVLTLNLTVSSDLEPQWSLLSDRAAAQDQARNISWADRVKLAPTRLGTYADYNLAWRRGSVLNLLSEERADASAALVDAAREARNQFGQQAGQQLATTLNIVAQSATELGIDYGTSMNALLDTHSISFSGGTISLHDEKGVPLRNLGIGSARLLIAELQKRAAIQSTISLVDELEYGLEPHRIMRLLNSIGAKAELPPMQVFATSHSPVVVRELGATQIAIVRNSQGKHIVQSVPDPSNMQGTIRLYPDALLAPSVLVCEGASEVGFMRGMDLFHCENGYLSLAAMGVALVDGGGITNLFNRAKVFQDLGYRTAVLRDDDVQPDAQAEQNFIANSGKVVAWRQGKALEDEIFQSVSDNGALELLKYAIDLHGQELINDHIVSASHGTLTLADCIAPFNGSVRNTLGLAARTRKAGWFKSVAWMEHATRTIVGPDWRGCEPGFTAIVADLFKWLPNG